MSKIEIDKYFQKNYKDIEKFAKSSLLKKNLFNEESDYFVSEIYMHVLKYADEISDEEILKNYISTFIYKNCMWTSSLVREMGKVTKKNNLKTVEFIYEKCDLSEEYKVEHLFEEFDLNDYQSIIELYYEQLNSLEKKVVWEIYFVHKKNSNAKFAKHIGRSRTVAEKYIKQLKKDLQEFYEQYKLNNK